MKSRLWPALLFAVAVASLPCVAGCTIEDNTAEPPVPCESPDIFADRSTVAAAFCTMLYCDSLDTPEAPALLGECQGEVERQLWVTGGVYTWDCAADMFEVSNACPDFRDLPPSCEVTLV